MGPVFILIFMYFLGLDTSFASTVFSLYEIERPESYHQIKPSVSYNNRVPLPRCDKSLLNGTYSLENPVFCDQFFLCDKGSAFVFQCEDGYAYAPFLGCKLLHTVDCSKRPKLQIPTGSGLCTRRNEIRADPAGCGRFIMCEDNRVSEGRCPPRQSFDDITKICNSETDEDSIKCRTPIRPVQPISPAVVVTSNVISTTPEPGVQVIVIQTDPTPSAQQVQRPFQENSAVEPSQQVVESPASYEQSTRRPYPVSSGVPISGYPPARPVVSYPQSISQVPLGCPTTGPCDPALANFRCPEESMLQFGDHARYPYYRSCKKFIICYRDRSFRVAGCEDGQGFHHQSKVCVAQHLVPHCAGEPVFQTSPPQNYLPPSDTENSGSPSPTSVVFSFGRPVAKKHPVYPYQTWKYYNK